MELAIFTFLMGIGLTCIAGLGMQMKFKLSKNKGEL